MATEREMAEVRERAAAWAETMRPRFYRWRRRKRWRERAARVLRLIFG